MKRNGGMGSSSNFSPFTIGHSPSQSSSAYPSHSQLFCCLSQLLSEVNIDSFYEYAINQHFYLDTLANILYSEVNYIDVYQEVITSMGIDLGRAFHFRVYMKRPSLYRKPVNHKIIK